MVGYARDHTLLITVLHKNNHTTAAAHFNIDLVASCHHWNTTFTIILLRTFSLVISLKSDVSTIHFYFWDSQSYLSKIWPIILLSIIFECHDVFVLNFSHVGIWYHPLKNSVLCLPSMMESTTNDWICVHNTLTTRLLIVTCRMLTISA